MNNSQNKHISYITGLRGIAIMMVVLFHLQPDYFANGFLGVDIFLVITGYLLFRDWNSSTPFQFLTFTKKKIARIYPPLSVLIVLAVLSSIPFLYSIGDAILLGKSALYSLLGVSNFYYMRYYSDYFATESNLNPLLHTWYLAVTIQVYLIWAILRTILRHFPHALRNPAVIILAICSIFYSFSYELQLFANNWGLVNWGQEKAISYYDTFGRIWEVLAGGIVYFLPDFRKNHVNTILSMIGFGLLCTMAFCNTELPSVASIATVICTILVLKYTGAGRCRMLIESKPLFRLGQISFSLYLLHFPIFVLYRHWEKSIPSVKDSIILLLLCIIMAWGLWKYIESRRHSRLCISSLILCAFITAGFVRGAHHVGIRWDAMQFPYPTYELTDEHHTMADSIRSGYNDKLLQGDAGTQLLLGSPYTQIYSFLSLSGKQDKPQFVLVGNSNAQHFYAGFHEICKAQNIPGIHLTTIVFPMWDYQVWRSTSYCWTKQKAHAFIDWLKQQPELHTVVISHLWKDQTRPVTAQKLKNWDGKEITQTDKWKLHAVREFCTQLNKIGKHVVILTPSPVFSDFDNSAYLGTGGSYVQWRKWRDWEIDPTDGQDPFIITNEEYTTFNTEVFRLLNRLEEEGYCKLLHIERGIFKEGNFCGVHNNTLYCRDKTHITPAASIYIMQGVADEFARIIQHNKNTSPQRK